MIKPDSNFPNIPQLFVPPSESKNPYQDATLCKNTWATEYKEIILKLQTFTPPDKLTTNIFIDANNYTNQTGKQLICVGSSPKLAKPFEQTLPKLNGGTMISDKFVEQNRELYLVNKDKLTMICNFTIKIVGISKRISSNGGAIEFIDVKVNKLNEKLISIPYEQYKTLFAIVTSKNPQLRHNSSLTASRAKDYFAEYASVIYEDTLKQLTVKEIYNFSGWAKVNAKMVYLSSAYDYCESDCYVPFVSDEESKLAYIKGLSVLSFAKNSNTNADEITNLKAILPIFLYAHAGYTAELLLKAGLNLQFLLAIIGTSGSYKTSLCKLLCEPFNTQGMLNFQSTPSAIELYRDSCRDMTMIMDDIFSNKDKEALAKFETILRCFGDNIAKAKSNATVTKIQQFTVRGGCIITAENNLPIQQSSALRCLVVKVDNNSFDGDIIKHFSKSELVAKDLGQPSVVQLYFAAYITYLQNNFDDIVKEIRNYEPPILDIKYPRLFSTYKAMCILAYLLIRWGLQVGYYDSVTAEHTLQIWYKVIQNVILENQQSSEVAAPYKLFITNMVQGIATGIFTLAVNKQEYEARGSKDYFGYIDKENNFYVLDPQRSFKFLEDSLKCSNEKVSFTKQTLLHDLYNNSISICYTEPYKSPNGETRERIRYVKKININGNQASMLVLSLDAVNQAIEN